MRWTSCTKKLPPCPRSPNALGTEVLIHPRGEYPTAFYGRRATGKPAFYLHGAEIVGVTHWMLVPVFQLRTKRKEPIGRVYNLSKASDRARFRRDTA